jgi:hypothetical protein
MKKTHSLPRPVAKRQSRGFYGLAKYYRSGTNFSLLADPPHELKKKKKSFPRVFAMGR